MPPPEPLVTIAIPTYNCAQYLPDALGSVLRQGLDDFEVLIMDNASEDATEEVVRSFGSERIRYIRNSRNLGSRENGRLCLVNSRGRYVRTFCADDVLLDGIVRLQLDILMTRPDVVLVTCDNFIADQDLNIEDYFPAFPGIHSGRRVIAACLSGMANYIGGPSNVMFRRSEAIKTHVDASYNSIADWKFYLKLLEHGGYANIDKPGYVYRRHATSDTQANCPDDLRQQEHLRLVGEFDAWNPLNCIKAVRAAGSAGRMTVADQWVRALAPNRIARALFSFRDVYRMHRLWRRRSIVHSLQVGQPSGAAAS
ncbi:MAG TPA: glycosyltransferase [Acidobacteriaceae bacterium]|jgi:glycosyltransferase involved in cell wall biosynthesis|nr:glycosyltransferase [Acidobacteriaceae bacterium]